MTAATTSIASKIRKTFDWDYRLEALTGPNGLQTPFYTLFRNDTNEQFGGAFKEGYVMHTVEDVIVLAEAAASSFGNIDECDVKCWWSGWAHEVVIEAPRDRQAEINNPMDIVWPRLHISAGFGTSFKGSLGLYRHACSNLMMPRMVAGTTKSIFHTTNLRPRIDELTCTFNNLSSHWDEMVDGLVKMANHKTKFSHIMTKVFGPGLKKDTAELTGLAQKRVEALMTRLLRDREALGNDSTDVENVTMWEALNAIQGYIQHDTNRRADDPVSRAFTSLYDQRLADLYATAYRLAV